MANLSKTHNKTYHRFITKGNCANYNAVVGLRYGVHTGVRESVGVIWLLLDVGVSVFHYMCGLSVCYWKWGSRYQNTVVLFQIITGE